MDVEVVPHRPRDVITKQRVSTDLYQIRVDGSLIGFIAQREGARPMLHARVSPMELKQIGDEVKRILGEYEQETGEAVQLPPEPPKTNKKKLDTSDDFD